ncbi:MAG: MBL fold metallo-hydrolase [Pseudomonadota bacterium]
MFKHFAVLVAATTMVGTIMAQEAEVPAIPVETIDLGSGVYALITNRGGNVGVLVGEDGVFMIDTQFPDVAPALDAAQKALSGGRDVDLVLNTHLHGDHVLGNGYFADRGATIMAHPNVRPGLMEPNTSELTGRTPDVLKGGFLPTVNINQGDLVTMNGQTALFYHTPDAHTDGDIFVHFLEADVIHAGDLLFSGRFPFIDLDNGGTVEGMIAGMQAIVDAAGPDTRVIAGHGPMSTEADLEASIAMLADGRAKVAALVENGMDLEAVYAEGPLADYAADWNWQFITTERMVWTFYRDITGKTE